MAWLLARQIARHPWLGPLMLLLILVSAVAIVYQLNLAEVNSKQDLEHVVDGYGVWTPLVYVVLYAITALVFPVSPMTVAGGLLFEFGPGLALSVTGALLGGIGSFLAVRNLGVKSMKGYLENRPGVNRLLASRLMSSRIVTMPGYQWFQKRFATIERPTDLASECKAITILFLCRMVGPFFAISFLAGMSRMSFKAYLLGTTLGAMVANLLLLVLSHGLIELFYTGDWANWALVLPLLAFLIVLALPVFYLRAQTRLELLEPAPESEDG